VLVKLKRIVAVSPVAHGVARVTGLFNDGSDRAKSFEKKMNVHPLLRL